MSSHPYNKDEIKYRDPEARREYMRAWHKLHDKNRVNYFREYRVRNKARLNQYSRDYSVTHADVRHKYYEKHKEAIQARALKWRVENHERAEQSRTKRRLEIRRAVFEKLGGVKCVVCGCTILELLQINHKNGGGAKEYKENGYAGGLDLYKRILEGSRSIDDLDVMCRICNMWYDILLRYGSEVANRFIIVFED